MGDDKIAGSEGDDTINVSAGNAVGGQDTLDLSQLFVGLGLTPAQAATRVAILDFGSTVDIRINADGDLANGYELSVATIQTADAETVGSDVIVG